MIRDTQDTKDTKETDIEHKNTLNYICKDLITTCTFLYVSYHIKRHFISSFDHVDIQYF